MKLATVLYLLAVPHACLGQGAPEVASPVLDSAARSAIVERALTHLQRDYVLPDSVGRVETEVRRQLAAGRYDALNEPRAFAARLTADLRAASRDRHLLVVYQPPPAPAANSPVAPLEPSVLNYGFERVERLPGNIGYIDLRSFDPPALAATACAAAMNFVANTEGLIIDLRNNTGGAPQVIALLGR